jgi:hypothetical protein
MMKTYTIKPLEWEEFSFENDVEKYGPDGQPISVLKFETITGQALMKIVVYTYEGVVEKGGVTTYDCKVSNSSGSGSIGSGRTVEEAKVVCENHWQYFMERLLDEVK